MPTNDVEPAMEAGDFVPSGPTAYEGRRKRRKPMLLVALLAGAVAVAVVVLPRQTKVQPPEVAAVGPVAAQPLPTPPEPAPPAPPAKTTVEISLDSNPQDARVIREDTGAVVGRTPLTLSLTQGREVISFRFEKDGHTPISYKVIPDLDKAVRAELAVEPTNEPRRAATALRHPAPHAREVVKSHVTEQPTAPAAPAADQPRACLLSVGSFPWTELWIDGKDTGQRTPVVHYPVTCGAHKLTLKRRDLRLDHVEQVTVAPGHELKQHYELGDEYGE